MKEWQAVKSVRHGDVIADVAVTLRERDPVVGPTLSLADVRRLERVRQALEAGRLREAAEEATLYRVEPLAVA